ncbi:hypothetical protein OPV22_029629 [Ensete ventricosum]|uniref:Uncharacterized protein n=1 Tax=Ensete ventricosum TaxID=4639 RepID=A0AAV8Q1P0_ENSVE|nr:hypothetical protein OPV22_029629 [Ensete ventricosum]
MTKRLEAGLDRFCYTLYLFLRIHSPNRISQFFQDAPHPPSLLMGDAWNKLYSTEYAAFPASWLGGA